MVRGWVLVRGTISALGASTLLTAIGFVAAPAPALAYENCNEIVPTATVTPSSAAGGASVTLTVRLTSCKRGSDEEEQGEGEGERQREKKSGDDGNAAANQIVHFSQESGPGKCHVTFSSPTATTDAKGRATVKVTLPRRCPGTYTLVASGADFRAEATVREKGGFFPGGEDKNFQNTSFTRNLSSGTTADSGQHQSLRFLPILLIGAGLAMVAAVGVGYIRGPRSVS
jgi:hypothetical protein